MIARIWHGTVPLDRASEYLKLMRDVAIPDYQRIPGNRLALVLRRTEDTTAHFLTLTLWESFEAIRTFAGQDVNLAKYYDFDAAFLTELEPTVQHYEVFDK